MRIKFGIYTSMIPSVQEVADAVTKNFRELTGGQEEILLGYRIATMTVDEEGLKDEKAFKEKTAQLMKDLFKEKGIDLPKVWLQREGSEDDAKG